MNSAELELLREILAVLRRMEERLLLQERGALFEVSEQAIPVVEV